MPNLDGSPKKTEKDPLGEFAGVGEFKNLNVKGGSFDGVEGEPDADADRALGEFARLGKTGGSSSVSNHGSASIPKEGGPDSQRSR